jgi:hypothetical protein
MKELFYEKLLRKSLNQQPLASSQEGLLRGDVEVFLYEQLGISELNDSHNIISQALMSKLQSKISESTTNSTALQTLKSIRNEHKVTINECCYLYIGSLQVQRH